MLVNRSINIGLLRSLTLSRTAGSSPKKAFKFRFAVLVALMLSFVTVNLAVQAAPQKRNSQRRRTQKPKASPQPKVDYTKFSHTTHVVNQKLACGSCHKVPSKNWNVMRKGDAAFPDVSDFPEHSSCLSCHKEQFFARERPAPSICSNCHIAVDRKS